MVVGAVLAGGASRRMGADKALLEVDGEPMAALAAAALGRAGASPVVVVGGGPAVGRLGLLQVDDDRPGAGPLAGLATALRWASSLEGVELVLVAACDQPDLDDGVLRALVGAASGPGVGAVVRTDDGRSQPFPSAWRVDAAPLVEGLVVAGERRMASAVGLGVVEVAAASSAVADLDTPADLARRRGEGGPLGAGGGAAP